MKTKRISYLKQLNEDLAIAIKADLDINIINDLNARIKHNKEYKHNWYLNSKSRKKPENG